MNRLILLNHESGESFESFNIEEMKKMIAEQIENGADLENLSLYKAEDLRIEEVITEKIHYKISKRK